MRLQHLLSHLPLITAASISNPSQQPLLSPTTPNTNNHPISPALFADLEEFARIVDIAYCVGGTSLGITKPFSCLSRCSDFPSFELVKTWNTGPLLADSCGYIALDHAKARLIVAFRGTYSVANTVVDLSTVPQEYVPYPGDGEDDDGGDDGGEEGPGVRGQAEEIVGEEIDWEVLDGVGGYIKREVVKAPSSRPRAAASPRCENCTVHMGFHTAWLHTRDAILEDLTQQRLLYPTYDLHLVGHSLGGAVAALAALDLQARGWEPRVTTFGEPRIGNAGLVKFLDERFNLTSNLENDDDMNQRYRRITHIDDPVPLLPLTEWSFDMHAGEIFISKSALSPDVEDIQHCVGDVDQECIAGQDSTTASATAGGALRKRSAGGDLLASVEDEIHDVLHEPWGIPSRYKLWQLFLAHRDYFWRLGLCVPSSGGGSKFEGREEEEGEELK